MKKLKLVSLGMLTFLITLSITIYSYGLNTAPQKAVGKTGNSQSSHWVISVKDNTVINNGSMKTTFTVNLSAANNSSDEMGDYKGAVKIKSVNKMSAGNFNATFDIVDPNLSFKVGFYTAPLTLPSSELAPLVKATKGPVFSGDGVVNASEKGTASAMGKKTSLSKNSSVKVKFFITVSFVKLVVTIPGFGNIYFDGNIKQQN